MTRTTMRVLSLFVALGAAAPVSGQQPPAPAGPRTLELGPLSLRPRLEIREIGVDDNVFNDPENPQSDFTATITPRVDAILRAGWTRLTSTTSVDFVYFKEFTDERSLNRSTEGRFEVGEGLLRPWLQGGVTDTHDRPNTEIDARAGRRQYVYGGGLGLALSSRTLLTAGARRTTVDYVDGATYRGVALSRTLNSHSDLFEGGLRMDITPLTSWETTAGVQRDRFEREPRRDADSVRVATALVFSPSALISGRASVGYRHFNPAIDTLAEFRGVVAQVSVTYAVESTRIAGQFERDVQYSFEELQPYYLATRGRLTATQRVAGPFDVQATVGRENMGYRAFEGGEEPSRIDRLTIYGSGIGYRLGDTARIGLNTEWSRRRSDTLENRRYDRQRIFGSLTYGF